MRKTPHGLSDAAPRNAAPTFIALIDYDNAKFHKKEYSVTDVDANLESLSEYLVARCSEMSFEPGEVAVRLYGGWINERGHLTQRCQWIVARLDTIRGLRRNVRLLPHLVHSIAQRSDLQLKGTCRTSRSPPEQKMVDTMIAVDLLHYAALGHPILLATDDDDLVPAILAARLCRNPHIMLARRRPLGAGLNDDACLADGMRLFSLPGAGS